MAKKLKNKAASLPDSGHVFQPTFLGIIIRAFFNTQTLKEISKITFSLRYFLVSFFFCSTTKTI